MNIIDKCEIFYSLFEGKIDQGLIDKEGMLNKSNFSSEGAIFSLILLLSPILRLLQLTAYNVNFVILCKEFGRESGQLASIYPVRSPIYFSISPGFPLFSKLNDSDTGNHSRQGSSIKIVYWMVNNEPFRLSIQMR